MKKSILIIITTWLMVTAMLAQEGQTSPGSDRMPTDPGQVPTQVTERFNREYPGISGSWSKDGDNFRVEFTDPNSRMSHVIIYDRNGEVIRRENEVDQVPQAINDYYQKNYPGEKLRTWRRNNTKGEQEYYTLHNKEQVRFDKEGKFIAPVKNKTVSGRPKSDK
jgi:hypothetical protein